MIKISTSNDNIYHYAICEYVCTLPEETKGLHELHYLIKNTVQCVCLCVSVRKYLWLKTCVSSVDQGRHYLFELNVAVNSSELWGILL